MILFIYTISDDISYTLIITLIDHFKHSLETWIKWVTGQDDDFYILKT